MTNTNDPNSGPNEQPGYHPPPGTAPVGPPPSSAPVGPPPGASPVGPPPGQVPPHVPPPAPSPVTPPVQPATSTDVWGADPTQNLPTAPAPYQAPPQAYPGTGYQPEIPQESSSQKGRIIAFAAIALLALGGIGFGVFALLGADADDDTTTVATVAEDDGETETTEVATTEPANAGLPADAPTFVDVFDDSGFLFVTVPDDWTVDGQAVSGSDNLEATGDQGDLLMFPLITEATPTEQLSILIDGWDCTMDGTTYDYDDGLFVGVGGKYTCDGFSNKRGEALVVTHPDGDRILVDTFMISGAEADLIRKKIFESFNLKLN